MIIKGKIDDLLQGWATEAMTDPWPLRVSIKTPDQLTYSALVCCACGAGMAYPTQTGSAWGCAAILTGEAQPGPEHSELYPFFAWKFKPENANQSTRNNQPLSGPCPD